MLSGVDVHKVLEARGVRFLHHANTVTTGCSFLRLGGLASRGFVEWKGLSQTWQYTDNLDKKHGLWHDVFVDGVDIHELSRAWNKYGPVLFKLPVSILLTLPRGTEVMVTRKNPCKWADDEPMSARYFLSADELQEGYVRGAFDQHIVFRTTSGILPFIVPRLLVLLDDPRCVLPDGTDAYSAAIKKLGQAAKTGKVVAEFTKRQCGNGCRCVSGLDSKNLHRWFLASE